MGEGDLLDRGPMAMWLREKPINERPKPGIIESAAPVHEWPPDQVAQATCWKGTLVDRVIQPD